MGKETFDRRTVRHFLFDNEVSYQVLLCKAHLIIVEIHLGDCNCQPYSNCQIIKSPSRLRFLGGSGPWRSKSLRIDLDKSISRHGFKHWYFGNVSYNKTYSF